MYPELYTYLLKNNRLTLPGIGTLLLEKSSAQVDFPNRKAEAAAYSVSMAQEMNVPADFYSWLGAVMGITAREAVVRFSDFVFDLKKEISAGTTVNWSGVGTINKGLAGEMKFIAEKTPVFQEHAIIAEKVIRDKAEHMVRVGEVERTSEEMTEMLNQPEKVKSLWWIWAAVAALISVLFIGWHFSEKGVTVSATANDAKLSLGETPASTYRILP